MVVDSFSNEALRVLGNLIRDEVETGIKRALFFKQAPPAPADYERKPAPLQESDGD